MRIIGLARLIVGPTGSESPIVHVPHEQVYGHGIEDMLHRTPLIDKIRDAIGWEPTLDLDRILRDVIDYHAGLPTAELRAPAPSGWPPEPPSRSRL